MSRGRDFDSDPPGEGLQVWHVEARDTVIPDDDPAGVDSVISLTESGRAREIVVEVAIRHHYIGDLRVELVSPSGVRAVLHDRTGANTHDLRRVFRSSEPGGLRALSGVPVRGDWRLRVVDTAKGEAGVLESWALAVEPDRGSDLVGAVGYSEGS